jgi:hypothetical protein
MLMVFRLETQARLTMAEVAWVAIDQSSTRAAAVLAIHYLAKVTERRSISVGGFQEEFAAELQRAATRPCSMKNSEQLRQVLRRKSHKPEGSGLRDNNSSMSLCHPSYSGSLNLPSLLIPRSFYFAIRLTADAIHLQLGRADGALKHSPETPQNLARIIAIFGACRKVLEVVDRQFA